jgi:hypothetical protein
MKLNKKTTWIVALCAALALTACGGEPEATPTPAAQTGSQSAPSAAQAEPTEDIVVEGAGESASAPTDLAKALIGKWRSDQVNGTFEFFPNGIAVQTLGSGANLAGTYALSADGKTLQFKNDSGPSAFQVSLSGGDILTVNSTEFKRASGVAGVANPAQPANQRIVGWWQQGNYDGTGYDFSADGTYAVYLSGQQEGKGRYQISDDGTLMTLVEPFGTQQGVRQRRVHLLNDAYLILELANVYKRTQDAPEGTQQASGKLKFQTAQPQAGGAAPSVIPTAMPYPVEIQVSLKGPIGQYWRNIDYSATGTPDTTQDEQVTITGELLKEPVPLSGGAGSYVGRVMQGSYTVQVRSKGYADVSVPVKLTEQNQTLEVPLQPAALEHDPADLVVLGGRMLRYDTGEVVRTGRSFDFARDLRPDGKSFLALDPQNSGNPWVIFASGEYWQQLTPDLPQFRSAGVSAQVPQAMTSPDAKRALFVLESDLWLGDVNWETGTIENPRQLTQVGLFRNARRATANWHPDGRVVAIDGKYRVDLETGDVKTIEDLSTFSPNSRYASHHTKQGAAIYDLATDTEFQSSANRKLGGCWLNDDRAVFAEKDGLWVISGTTESRVNVSALEIDNIAGCRGSYAIVYPQPNPNRTVALINVDTGQSVEAPANTTELHVNGDYAVVGVQDQDDLEARGTFLLNLKSGELKKLSAYPVNRGGDEFSGFGLRGANAAILTDKNTILFVANEHVWKSDLSGAPAQRLIEGDDTWASRSAWITQLRQSTNP